MNLNKGVVLEYDIRNCYKNGEFIENSYGFNFDPHSPYLDKEYRNPETGEKLYPDRVYCDKCDYSKCYYVELHDSEGRKYYYADESYVFAHDEVGKTLDRQLAQDRAELEKNMGENYELRQKLEFERDGYSGGYGL